MRRLLLVLTVFAAVFLGGAGLWYRSYLTTPAPGQGEVVVTIPRGAGVRGIGAQLAAQGILGNDIRYLALVSFSGLRTRLKAGE